MEKSTGTNIVRPMSIAELAAVYGVSARVLKRWLRALSAGAVRRQGRYFTSRQVASIMEVLGWPWSDVE